MVTIALMMMMMVAVAFSGGGPCKRKTTTGKCCTFPLHLDGRTYHDCVTLNNNNKEWCATTADYAADGQWGYCAEEAPSYNCKFSQGNGVGKTDIWVSNDVGQACINRCLNKKKTRGSVNGVTVYLDGRPGCYCVISMKSIRHSSIFKTCFLAPIGLSTIKEPSEPKRKRPYRCKFGKGNGVGKTDIKIGNEVGQACIDACVRRKKTRGSAKGVINGVTVRLDGSPGCYCEINMRRIGYSRTYKTCFLISNGKEQKKTS